MRKKKKDVSIYLGLLVGFSLGIILWRGCEDQGDLSQDLQTLQDSIIFYQGQNGELLAKNTTLIGSQEELLALQVEKDHLIQKLQEKLQERGDRIQDITTTATSGEVNLPFDLFFQEGPRDTLLDTITIRQDPHIQILQFRDTVALELTDTITFYHTYQRGILGPRGLTVHAGNVNPYVKIKGLSSWTVAPLKQKRIGVGIMGGIGISKDLQPVPMIGAGIYYRIW